MSSLKVFGNRSNVFLKVENYLQQLGFKNYSKDDRRPWGGFFVIGETDAALFLKCFYAEEIHQLDLTSKISPKILIVEPSKQLSWQYHHRRSEIWKLIGGTAAVVRSDSDNLRAAEVLLLNSTVTLRCGERHRLIGGTEWGVVAEIWRHTDASNPSDEDDIVRLHDDFGRGLATVI